MSTVVKLDQRRSAPASLDRVTKTAEPDALDDLDKASLIILAAVTYTAQDAAMTGAWKADHTGNCLFAGEAFAKVHGRRRNSALRSLTRLLRGADAVRWSEIWAAVSVAGILIERASSGATLDREEWAFLKALIGTVERDCGERRTAESE